MARYIDVEKIDFSPLKDDFDRARAKVIILRQPTADVEEVKHGEWIYNTDDFTPKMRCSVCGYNKPIAAGENIEQQPSDYCNKCGAKMDRR